MRAESSPSLQRLRLALQACPFVGAALLVDDPARPGEPGGSSMFCASLALPSSKILAALNRLEALLPASLPASLASKGGLLGLMFEAPEALDALIEPSCERHGLGGFGSSSAYANIHERNMWAIRHEPSVDESAERPLIGMVLSYYGSGANGKLGARAFHSRDAFACLWREFAKRAAARLEIDEPLMPAEGLTLAPHLHNFHTEIPSGLARLMESQAERAWLDMQTGHAPPSAKHRPAL